MNYELNVLVNGRKLDVYEDPNSPDIYIEGRNKTEYQIELKNNTYTDAEFVVSVDGLSIIDGKPAGRNSEGYIVAARSSVLIPGWLVDEQTAAKFVFGTVEASYAYKISVDTDNTGVIGLQVFPRKPYFNRVFTPLVSTNPWSDPFTKPWSPFTTCNWEDSSRDIVRSFTLNASSVVGASSSQSGPDLSAFSHPEEVSSLGTEFGESTNYGTRKVSFERASSIPSFSYAVQYATAKELNKLGIVLKWQVSERKKPQPFPADYCQPPAGWRK